MPASHRRISALRVTLFHWLVDAAIGFLWGSIATLVLVLLTVWLMTFPR